MTTEQKPLFDFDSGATPPPSDVPPSGRKPRADRGKKRGPRKGTRMDIASGVEEIHTAVGVMISVVNQTDGELIVENAARAGALWAHAAQRNDKVRQALERFLMASTFAEIVAFYMTIGVKIAVNHGVLPDKFGPIFAQDEPSANGHVVGMPDLSSVPVDVLQGMFPHFDISQREESDDVPGYTP